MPLDPDEIAKQTRGHAWDWFALHAVQRMQSFNFFLVATAFLFAAYATLLEKHPDASFIVALMGAWLAYWFNRIDHRSRQLVKAGEQALAISEERLAALADINAIKLVEAVERPAGRFNSTYGKSISMIQGSVILAFIAGAVYAVLVALDKPFLTKDEARRIAVNVAKLRGLLRRECRSRVRPDHKLPRCERVHMSDRCAVWEAKDGTTNLVYRTDQRYRENQENGGSLLCQPRGWL